MDRKIIKTGLSCKVNAKVALMQRFLSDDETSRIVVRKVKELGVGKWPVPEERQAELRERFGIQINSVTRLDDEALEKAYDALQQDGRINTWLNNQAPNMKERAKQVLAWDQETVTIDVTGFLVYAVVEDDRCRQALMDCMKEQGEACYQAYRESAYFNGPLVRWFPYQKMLAAMLCIGLLERIRAEDGDKEAYESFISIASSGYKRVRKYVKKSDGISGAEFKEIMSMMDPETGLDPAYCLSAGVMGLLMAEDVQIPIRPDFLMLSFLPLLKEWGNALLEATEPVEISEEGTERCREVLEEYHCDEENWIVRCLYREPVDPADVCNIFGINIRALREVTMTETELQQLFSLCPDIAKENVAPFLAAAALCKYTAQREGRYRTAEELERLEHLQKKGTQEENQRSRIREIRQKQEELRQEQLRLRQERDALAVRIAELEQAVARRKEQIGLLKSRQEQARQEVKELRNFVCYLTEHACEEQGEGRTAGSGQRQKLNLERRRVVVIGGHENWQRRFREQFPMWQFLPANKNNFDAGCVRNKEIIIVNTAVLKHSCYYRIMAERSEEQTVLYVHGNNLERCLDELERQLEAG